MLVVAIVVFVVVAAVIIIAVTARHVRPARPGLPPDLVRRRGALRQRLARAIERVPAEPSSSEPVEPLEHGGGTSVEARLLAGDTRGALRQAEQSLADSPDDPEVHVVLARALLYCGELDAAAGEIARARELGAGGAMLEYLDGRIGHVRASRRPGASADDPLVSPLITPFELFILQIERQRSRGAASVWLPGDSDRTLDRERMRALVAEHFAGYYDSLDRLLCAVEQAPGFADALYHAARLALKVGFIDEGRALFERLEPHMAASLDRAYYQRDLAQVRDQDIPPEPVPAIAPGARRPISLKIVK